MSVCAIAKKFHKTDWQIMPIPRSLALQIVIEKHYLHREAPCELSFGLFKTGFCSIFMTRKDIQGVVIYGTPSSAPLRAGICGDSEKDNVIELTRLWVSDAVPKNGESFLVGNTLPLVSKQIIVSFADTAQQHVGYIYQATNFFYTGLSAKRTDWKVEGIDTHSQTLADKYSAEKIRALYGERFYLEERSRKHRYVFFNCSRKRKKQLLSKLNYPIKPYPKMANGGV